MTKIKGVRKLIGLILILLVALIAHLKGGMAAPLAAVLSSCVTAFMAGNGMEQLAQNSASAPAPLQAVEDKHGALMTGIVGQLKDLSEGVVALLKKT